MESERTLTFKIRINTGASDAAKYCYLEELTSEIKDYLSNLKYDSWRSEIHENWEDSHPLDLEIEFEK